MQIKEIHFDFLLHIRIGAKKCLKLDTILEKGLGEKSPSVCTGE